MSDVFKRNAKVDMVFRHEDMTVRIAYLDENRENCEAKTEELREELREKIKKHRDKFKDQPSRQSATKIVRKSKRSAAKSPKSATSAKKPKQVESDTQREVDHEPSKKKRRDSEKQHLTLMSYFIESEYNSDSNELKTQVLSEKTGVLMLSKEDQQKVVEIFEVIYLVN